MWIKPTPGFFAIAIQIKKDGIALDVYQIRLCLITENGLC
jgi:hypothetical protein